MGQVDSSKLDLFVLVTVKRAASSFFILNIVAPSVLIYYLSCVTFLAEITEIRARPLSLRSCIQNTPQITRNQVIDCVGDFSGICDFLFCAPCVSRKGPNVSTCKGTLTNNRSGRTLAKETS